jgi:hypothetical protein
MAGAGKPVFTEDPLHPVLVAEVGGSVGVDSFDSEPLPYLGQGHLKLFQRPQDRAYPAQLGPESLYRLQELSGLQCISDLVVSGESRSDFWRELVDRIMADQADPDSW